MESGRFSKEIVLEIFGGFSNIWLPEQIIESIIEETHEKFPEKSLYWRTFWDFFEKFQGSFSWDILKSLLKYHPAKYLNQILKEFQNQSRCF